MPLQLTFFDYMLETICYKLGGIEKWRQYVLFIYTFFLLIIDLTKGCKTIQSFKTTMSVLWREKVSLVHFDKWCEYKLCVSAFILLFVDA